MKRYFVAILLAASALVGCGPSAPSVDQNGQPIPQPQSSGALTGFLAGMGGGMLANWLSRPSQPTIVHAPSYSQPAGPATVVNKTVVNKTVINQTVNKAATPTTAPKVNPVPTPTAAPKPAINLSPKAVQSYRSSSVRSSSSSSSRSGRR